MGLGIIKKFFQFRQFLLYGIVLGILLVLMAWAKYRFLIADHAIEIYILLIAAVFTSIGMWAGLRWSAPRIIEKPKIIEVPIIQSDIQQRPKEELLKIYNLSLREWETLVSLSSGLTNEQIAEKLFISNNTVKTHLGNLYAKLDVKRRTEAVKKAREIGLLK
jgi:DNA-binding CsgD family transcriptional regulator